MSVKLGKALADYVLHARPISLGTPLYFKSERRMLDPASIDNVRIVIRRLYSKVGITGWHVGTHALRRTVGSHLYNAGNDLKTVADLLEPTSVSTTKAYVRIDVESLREVASSWPRREVSDMSNKITSLVTAYLDYKRGLGFQMTAEAVYLNAFAKYTQDIGYTGALTRKIVLSASL